MVQQQDLHQIEIQVRVNFVHNYHYNVQIHYVY